MASIRSLWRGAFGWEQRRRLKAFITGDDAPTWRRFEYKRSFGRSLIRSLMAADTPPWNRVVMNAATRKLVDGLGAGRLDALEISGEGWRDFGFRSFHSAHHPEYDICAVALPDRFDIVIAEQVFEHLLWPYKAGRNVFEMLRPGGHFLITTPFLFPVHNAPVDCSRWTETGLRYFLAECGFPPESCMTGSWGNRVCVARYLKRGTNYRPRLHSLRNEPSLPIVVWAMARKP